MLANETTTETVDENGQIYRVLPNGRDRLTMLRGGKRSSIQVEAAKLGEVLRTRWQIEERYVEYAGGW